MRLCKIENKLPAATLPIRDCHAAAALPVQRLVVDLMQRRGLTGDSAARTEPDEGWEREDAECADADIDCDGVSSGRAGGGKGAVRSEGMAVCTVCMVWSTGGGARY